MFGHATFTRNAKLIALIALIAATAGAPRARAQGPTKTARGPAEAAPKGDEKVDVSDLEKKYWSAKDTDFNVVQNRLYSKAKRFSLSGTVGSMINDPWTTGSTYGMNLGYYFSERWGLEAVYNQTDSVDNQAVQRLRAQGGTPDHNQPKNFYGLALHYVPFYAKMSVLNWAIIYFDMSFAVGAGMQSYSQVKEEGDATVSTPAVTFDVTQTYFMSKTFALRVDFKNRWYSEETMKYRTNSTSGGQSRGNGSGMANTSFLLIGFSLFY